MDKRKGYVLLLINAGVRNSVSERKKSRWLMLNVYKNQQNRQTGSRNLMGPKTLPTIWGTYMKLVTKYQISAINSCWEKCVLFYLCPSKIFFVTFFSVTVDGRNLIFGHKLHIGTPYGGKHFWTHQIPTSCLLTQCV
jgi:hypothetical protein